MDRVKSRPETKTRALYSRYFDPSLPLEAQTFNLLGLAGFAAGIAVALSSVATNAGAANVALNLAASALALVLLRLTEKKQISRRAGTWVVVVAVFLLAFPVLFFTAGGYRSGMPCFFVFAIIFTAILLEKRERAAALALEFALYAACCLTAYFRPATVTPFPTEFDYAIDVITGITAASILLTAVVLLQIRMYHIRETQIGEQGRELEARNETLMRQDRMKSDFLAAVSHEISKPLAVISASSADTIALLGDLPEAPANMEGILENHERIEKRVSALDRVITDLMDITAIETGRLALSRQLLDLAGLLKSVCDASFKKEDVNNNRLTYDLRPNLPPIWADPARIEQVLANLISNAVRHTKDGEIAVKLTRTGSVLTVSVSDSGEGMDAAIAEVVMKEYAPSVQGDYWRHGFGLMVCRQIITSHGGKIWIDSEAGKGTTVSFTLPN